MLKDSRIVHELHCIVLLFLVAGLRVSYTILILWCTTLEWSGSGNLCMFSDCNGILWLYSDCNSVAILFLVPIILTLFLLLGLWLDFITILGLHKDCNSGAILFLVPYILLLFLPPELWGDCVGVYGLHFDSRVENHWNWVAIRAERTAPGCPRPTYNLVLYLWPYVPGLRCDYRIASGLWGDSRLC